MKQNISFREINKINPDIVPFKLLSSGDKIPIIGLGTFGSDSIDAETIAKTVKNAIFGGYRHIDCASVYGNENEIGVVLKDCIESGIVKRDELWITSKVWNDKHDNVIQSCKQSLTNLNLEYLDLYLVHWPFPNFHPPNCDVTSRSPNAKAYIHDEFMKTWAQMEKLVEIGLVKNIGTSNMTVPKLKLLLRDCAIRPVCNEMELHPHFQQGELFEFCRSEKIQPIGYSPLGSPGRPERDRTKSDTVDMEDPVILKIADKQNISPSSVCLRWAIQRGQIPIPFSVNHFMDNLETAISEPLTENDMIEIEKIDKGCRLIKGQVFLWKDNQSWEDLWDLNGEITPP